MFAVVKTGGKQYCVKPGDVFKVEKINVEPDEKISLSDVLLTSSDNGEIVVGTPLIKGVYVNAEVLRHVKNKKTIVFKKIRRHNHRRKNGHRQWATVLKVLDISLSEEK